MEASPLARLKQIRDQLRDRGWAVTCFSFAFNQHGYLVLVKRYLPPAVKPEWAVVELVFIDRTDGNRRLAAPANGSGLLQVDARTLREFFRIRWSENLGSILHQFAEDLGNQLPVDLPESLPLDERKAVLAHLSASDGEDPEKIYCSHVRRNPRRRDGQQSFRSAFNSQKTEILRPELFAELGSDVSISFCYSKHAEQERSDLEILRLLSVNQGR